MITLKFNRYQDALVAKYSIRRVSNEGVYDTTITVTEKELESILGCDLDWYESNGSIYDLYETEIAKIERN